MRKSGVAVLALTSMLAIAAMAARPDAESRDGRGRKGPWTRCGAEMQPPRRTTFAYSAADAARMARLQAEIIARVEEMNAIVRRTNGKPAPTGPVVQFTLFTGCPEGRGGDAMMEFIQQPESSEAYPDSFFDVFTDIDSGSGGGSGGNGGSGGCHCETNQVSCEGPCPC